MLSRDFRRLWGAFSVSTAGSAIGAGALPLVAVLELDASGFQVSLLTALSAVVSALIMLPLGFRIEHRRKRPVMIAADIVQFGALASVPVAAGLDVLTYAQLCVVGVAQATASIMFTAASEAHLKALVEPELRGEANSRFESTVWLCQSAGPPVGGALISALGATTTLVVDAVSFLLSALGIRRIDRPEPDPPARTGEVRLRREIAAGWTYILARPGLRALFWNAMLFGGSVMLCSPLVAVLMLRDLGLAPWQYGLALGLPCLGGVAGARLMPRWTARFGARKILLLSGVLRTPWFLVLPLAPPGTGGMVVIIVAETGLLFAAGVFNPSFVTYRMSATEDGYMARVTTAWSISSKTVQPVFMIGGGVLATFIGIPAAIAVGGVLCLASVLLLPWRASRLLDAPRPGLSVADGTLTAD